MSHLTLYKTAGYRSSIVGLYSLTLLLVLNVMGVFDSPILASPPVLSEAVQPVSTQTPPAVYGRPVRIMVPSLSLDIPIIDGIYNSADGSWTLDFDHAHFALPSVMPNDIEGNTFIYGHNSTRIFGRLWRLGIGEVVEVHTDNSHVFYYKYRGLRNVQPNDVSVFEYHGAPILTLQTCTGNWNELRRLFEFTLERVT